jgi:hypothetical protein
MKCIRYNNIINAVWYQALWFTAILGQTTYEWALALLLVLHLFLVPNWRTEVKVMLACGLVGITADSTLTYFEVYVFTPNPSLMGAALPIPFWLMTIWLGFAGTLLHSFSFFMTRPILGTLIVAAIAPFSYAAGVRFGAVGFGPEAPTAMIIIGTVWLCLMPLLGRISGVWQPSDDQSGEDTGHDTGPVFYFR